MGIEEREEVQVKEICNVVNTIIIENFPNLEKTMPIQVQEASRTDLAEIELPYNILSLKEQEQTIKKDY
jgi:hypothetical protein